MIQQSSFQGFDIIGDVHGCASALEQLLKKLGYQETALGYQYGDANSPRQAIFVGDLIDRGSEIKETLAIVKAMYDNGSALVVMGNHEFNAVAYHQPYKDDFLRARNERSNKQIKETLEQFQKDEFELRFYLEWFKTLPLFLEFEQFRVVHACWDNALIQEYWHEFSTNQLPRDFIATINDYDALSLRVIDRLTKGLSLPVPDGEWIVGRDGFHRKSFRVDFWTNEAKIYNDIVFQPDPIPEGHRNSPLSDHDRAKLVHYALHEKPLFIGHYWLSGMPALVRPNIACLDYSAVNNGKLVAYRFNVQQPYLDNRNFVFVDGQG